jgi:hypothetical protein
MLLSVSCGYGLVGPRVELISVIVLQFPEIDPVQPPGSLRKKLPSKVDDGIGAYPFPSRKSSLLSALDPTASIRFARL